MKKRRTKRPPRPSDSEAPECACGCGRRVIWSDSRWRWNFYISNHHTKLPPLTDPPLCECGCGQHVEQSKYNHKWNKFLGRHRLRIDRGDPPLCSCGCGKPVNWDEENKCWRGRLQKHGKNPRIDKPANEIPPLCQCGCGKEVGWDYKKGRWCPCVVGHNTRLDWANPEYAEKARKRMQSKEFRDRSRRLALERWGNDEFRAKMKAITDDAEYREKHRKNTTANWQDPDFVEKVFAGKTYLLPNKLEAFFDSVSPSCVQYVGNGDFVCTWENGSKKNPDYKVVDQDRIVEIWGDFWHADDDLATCIEMWWRIGFECLILWERDIRTNLNGTLALLAQFIDQDEWQMDLPGMRQGEARQGGRGEDNPASKLTTEDVLVIRQLYAETDITQRELGERFGVTQGHVGTIVTRKCWQHI